MINSIQITSWERFYRGNFINSLSGFKSVSLIGTKSKTGISNLAVFSNIVHLGADPALIGFVNRPIEAGGNTISNIEENGFYTINHIHANFSDKAHQTSAKYTNDENEFLKVGLNEEWIENFNAPFVFESKIKYGLSLQEIIPINLNKTFFVIGKIETVIIDEKLINPDGFIDLVKAETMCSSGIDSYHSVKEGERFAYAKVNLPARKL